MVFEVNTMSGKKFSSFCRILSKLSLTCKKEKCKVRIQNTISLQKHRSLIGIISQIDCGHDSEGNKNVDVLLDDSFLIFVNSYSGHYPHLRNIL